MSATASKYAVIVGLGRTGISCVRYLRARGWRLAVTDTRAKPPEMARLAELDATIPVRVGVLDPALLDGADLVVASPGVSLAEPFFMKARRLVCRRSAARVLPALPGPKIGRAHV